MLLNSSISELYEGVPGTMMLCVLDCTAGVVL